MHEFFAESATVGVVISFLAYYVGTLINKRFKLAILNPMLANSDRTERLFRRNGASIPF